MALSAMVKSRFSSLDVRAMVNSIRPEAVGCKLTNIYDINSKVYILKLARKNFKRFLLLESGVRFHITDYTREKSAVPSNYTMKLRKHIRTKRLTDVRQLGADRAVIFTFGRDENAFHLILELYVSGNLILTDHEYKILVLLRTHSDKDNKVAVREVYPVDSAMGLLVPEPQDFEDAVEEILDKASRRQENQEEKAFEQEDREAAKKGKNTNFSRKKRPDHMAMPLFQVLHKLVPWADPVLCASCVAAVARADGHEVSDGFKANVQDFSMQETVQLVQKAAQRALEKLQSVSRPGDLGGGNMPKLVAVEEGDDKDDEEDEDEEQPAEEEAPAPWEGPVVPGWILKKRIAVPAAEGCKAKEDWANEDFTALQPEGLEEQAVVAYPSFHRTVDEFFMQLEESKRQEQKAQHAQSVYARVERIRVDQGRRVEALEAEQMESEKMAEVIEANVELVERALAMLNAMVASQFDWGELWREVKRQQRLGHPIAQHIHAMELVRNEVSLLLSMKPDDDEVEVDEDEPMKVVPLDISLSARANVARLHAVRKQTREKTSKTLAQAEQAIKQAERKAQQDLQKYQLKQSVRKVRQTWWFEKFQWFLSSENYLVLSGRDATQADQIFRRHVGPKDVFLHADVAGATACFVKSLDGREIPPSTLREAGTAVLCRSSAWDKHIVISPWWVPLSQVYRGKAPNNAESIFLSDGFIVQGQRRFLPPVHLEMGLTLLFHVQGEGAAERHRGERKSRYLEAMGGALSMEEPSPASKEDEGSDEEVAVVEEAEEAAAEAEAAEEPSAPAVPAAEEPERAAGNPQEEEAEAPEQDDEAEQPAAEEPSARAEEDGGDAPSGRLRQSKAERRRQKKGQPANGAAGEEAPSEPAPPVQKSAPAALPAQPKAKAQQAVLPRGQKAKQRKIKEKYADQDEEERELRLALLGSKATKREAAASAKGGAAAEDPEEEGEEEEPTKAPPAAAQPKKAAQPFQHEKKQRGQQGKAADNVESVSAGCETDLQSELLPEQLDILTGQPQLEDEVLYAIPMVAPYCALGGPYTLRAKITPGSVKKSQAVRTCLKLFETQLERPAWRQLLQAIPEADTAGLLCGGCKLSMPGLQKLQAQAKREAQKDMKRREKEKGAAS